MKCTKCEGKLQITNTYDRGIAKYARARCAICGKAHLLTTTITPVTKRGEGARARASQHSTEDISS